MLVNMSALRYSCFEATLVNLNLRAYENRNFNRHHLLGSATFCDMYELNLVKIFIPKNIKYHHTDEARKLLSQLKCLKRIFFDVTITQV